MVGTGPIAAIYASNLNFHPPLSALETSDKTTQLTRQLTDCDFAPKQLELPAYAL